MTDKSIAVNHVTRIEGHGNITAAIKDGILQQVQFSVVEAPRFFEAFSRGHHHSEVTHMASRVCGICAVSHKCAALKGALNRVPFIGVTQCSPKVSLQGDFGIQKFADRTAFLRLVGSLLKLALVDFRDLGLHGQVAAGNGEVFADLVQSYFGGGLDVFGGKAGFSQDFRKSHGKAGGMGRADQLFRVAAFDAFEALGKSIGMFVEGAAFGGNGSSAFFQSALPLGRAMFLDRHILSP